MSYQQVVKCESCSNSVECHPDEGPPTGWYLLAKMGEDGGCWYDDKEWHLCSMWCVRAFADRPTTSMSSHGEPTS